ncbi:MAG: hypothetical protein ABSE89_07245 [Sedimentisphaerales bacterium]
MNKRIFLSIIIAAELLFVFGCNAPREQLLAYNNYFEASDFNSASGYAEKKIHKGKNPDGDDLLWTLQAAAARRILKDFNSSTQYFDTAEKDLHYYDTRFSLDEVTAIAINDNAMPYKGEEYDGVMANTYKALNFMSENKPDLARVEFNRAIDRQRRTKEKFEKEISERKAQIDKMPYGNLVNQTTSDPKMEQTLHDKYPQLYEYQAYKDYINPFVTYLASVYFNATGEPSTARDLLKETYGLVPENKYVEAEFKETEELLAKNENFKNTVWVVFENGLGPVKEEFRIDLPLFVATSRVLYAGIALPKLKYRDIAFSYLQIEADGKSYDTAVVSNMDRVIHSEFKKDFESILFRAIISTTGKVVAQYALSQQDSAAANIGSIMIAAYSFATNAADVRIWTSLPKDFQIARFPKPQNKMLKITPLNAQPFDIELPDCDNVLVYIKIINRNSRPVCNIIPL